MSSVEVELLNSMGTDLTVANAARVSFQKHHKTLTEGDVKLIKYLAKHKHWTPFGHVQLQFRIKAPVFVARQLVKHQVGLVWKKSAVDTSMIHQSFTIRNCGGSEQTTRNKGHLMKS